MRKIALALIASLFLSVSAFAQTTAPLGPSGQGGGGGGGGGVSSVGLALPVTVFTVSGSPVTGSGTLTGTFTNQSANTFFAGPTSGAATTPTFRAISANDFNTGTGASSSTFLRGDLTWQPAVQSITFGAGATGGVCTSICVTQARELVTTLTGATPTILFTHLAGLENLSNSSSSAASIPGAGSANIPAGWYTDACNINTGVSTLTPSSGTIGGASPYIFPAASSANPLCARLVSDGVSNFAVLFPTPTAATLSGTTLNSAIVTSSLTATGTMTSGKINTGYVIGGVTMTLGADATGDIYYRAAGGVLTRLAVCTGTNVLGQSGGLPACVAQSGGSSTITANSTATSGFSAGQVLYSDGSLVQAAGITGTLGNVVLSASPTLSGTIGGTLTFSGGLTLSSALTYGGVMLSNSVSGTGSMALTGGPTFTGTAGFAAITATGAIITTNTTGPTLSSGQLALGGILGTPVNPGANGEGQIYLSSTNGLVIQGKGSTSDITFENSTGAGLSLATGSSTFNFGGNGAINAGTAGALILSGGLTTGTVTVKTQNNAGAASSAGNVSITGGNGTGTGASNGGSVVITAGTSTNGTAGNIQLASLTQFSTSSTGAGAQTFTNSPCTGLTSERWISVQINGQTGTWFVPACQ